MFRVFDDDEDYVVILYGDCGEEIEIWEPEITKMTAFCPRCDRIHQFSAI